MIKKLLIIEDEAFIALSLQNELFNAGFTNCTIAANGEDAVKIADRINPDALIMDISLPGKINGIEAARIIRNKKNVPVIFITGQNDQTIIAQARKLNMSKVLDKPVKTCELLGCINSSLNH